MPVMALRPLADVQAPSSSSSTNCQSPLMVERVVRPAQLSVGLSPPAADDAGRLRPSAAPANHAPTARCFRLAPVRPRVCSATWCASRPGCALRRVRACPTGCPPHRRAPAPAPAAALLRAAPGRVSGSVGGQVGASMPDGTAPECPPARSCSPLGNQRSTRTRGVVRVSTRCRTTSQDGPGPIAVVNHECDLPDRHIRPANPGTPTTPVVRPPHPCRPVQLSNSRQPPPLDAQPQTSPTNTH